MSFLHGVETIELRKGPQQVRVPRTAVIGLVGTAPRGPVNELTVVRNLQDAAQFGEQLPGFTIPQALADIFKQGGATVVVVNVVDTTQNTNTLAVTSETFEIENRAGKLDFAPFGTLVITDEGGGEVVAETLATAQTGASLYNSMSAGDTVTVTLIDGDTETELGSHTVTSGQTASQIATAVEGAVLAGGEYTGDVDTSSGQNTFEAPVGSGDTWNGRFIRITKVVSSVSTDTDYEFTGGVTASDGFVYYTAGTDYTVDAFGNVTILAPVGTIAEGATLKATYRKFNEPSVTNNQIIGTVSGSTKTGFKLFENAFNMLGFKARYFIAPEYSDVAAIAQEMIAVANKHRGRALIDAPAGTTVANAIAGRGPSGTGALNFNTSSKRAILCYPRLKVDGAPDGATTRPYSQFLAGVIAATHRNDGYWFSPSNREIVGVTGPELPLSFAYNDENTDCNALNEVGIVTVANTFGTGVRTWGNRSAAFPSSTFPDNFIAVGDVQDICHDALELAMMQFLDRPINQATIDAIRDTVNGFFRTLIQRGAIVDGECTFDLAKNPPEELGAGHLTFDLTFMPPTPAERITFESFLDINLLKTLQ